MRASAIIVIALLLAAAAVRLTAQEDVKFGVTTRVVIAPTTVLDRDNRFVNGLHVDEFTLTDNDRPQIVKQDVVFQPLSIVVAIQANADMDGLLPKIRRIGADLTTLVAGESGEVAIMCFDHRIRTLQEFTNDGTKIDAALKKITAGSSSSVLNDATMQAINMLRNRPKDRRRIIILISETRDIAGSFRPREVMEAATFANVLIYAVDIPHLLTAATRSTPYVRPPSIPAEAHHSPTGGVLTPTEQLQMTNNGNYVPVFVEIFKGVKGLFIDNPSEVYTKYTGGREYTFGTQRGLERVISDIGEELHSQYLLSYTPTNVDEAGFHVINVTVKGRPGLKIRTRPGYYVAGGQQ